MFCCSCQQGNYKTFCSVLFLLAHFQQLTLLIAIAVAHGLLRTNELIYLKSGRVNFILPCSVAIFSARGTASSQCALTQTRNHLHKHKQFDMKY